MVDVIIAYAWSGDSSEQMLRMCLNRLFQNTDQSLFRTTIVYQAGTRCPPITPEMESGRIETMEALVPDEFLKSGSRRHGSMVDSVVAVTGGDQVLTLDMDCFPIAPGWLKELLSMSWEVCPVVGIRHPWKPPPKSMRRNTLDYRVRSQICWDHTHMACQMVLRRFLREHDLKYVTGDDTGLEIPLKARALELKVDGFMPSRCALPDDGVRMNPEYNRETCVVYGDMIYHHGGSSREADHDVWPVDFFRKARREVELVGPEFLLELGRSYEYRFDREEAVSEARMKVMSVQMMKHLESNASLFGPAGGL